MSDCFYLNCSLRDYQINQTTRENLQKHEKISHLKAEILNILTWIIDEAKRNGVILINMKLSRISKKTGNPVAKFCAFRTRNQRIY